MKKAPKSPKSGKKTEKSKKVFLTLVFALGNCYNMRVHRKKVYERQIQIKI